MASYQKILCKPNHHFCGFYSRAACNREQLLMARARCVKVPEVLETLDGSRFSDFGFSLCKRRICKDNIRQCVPGKQNGVLQIFAPFVLQWSIWLVMGFEPLNFPYNLWFCQDVFHKNAGQCLALDMAQIQTFAENKVKYLCKLWVAQLTTRTFFHCSISISFVPISLFTHFLDAQQGQAKGTSSSHFYRLLVRYVLTFLGSLGFLRVL